jgi:transcriptional regulator with XRE-family HTH domain
MTEASPAIVRSYDDLRRAIAARRRELGLSQRDVDHRAGLTDSHLSKIECGVRHFGDLTLGLVLETLGLVLVVRPRDPEAIPR